MEREEKEALGGVQANVCEEAQEEAKKRRTEARFREGTGPTAEREGDRREEAGK